MENVNIKMLNTLDAAINDTMKFIVALVRIFITYSATRPPVPVYSVPVDTSGDI